MIARILGQSVSVNNREIVEYVKGIQTPNCWKRSAILRNYVPMVFSNLFGSTDHSCRCGKVEMLLSDELGLQIRRMDESE